MSSTSEQFPSRVFTAAEVLSPYEYVFYAAFIVSFVFTPIMRIVAIHYGIVDKPDAARKVHAAPVAYLGGVAIFLGLLAGLVVGQYQPLHRYEPGWPVEHPSIKLSIVLGALIVVVLGLWDDLHKIKPAWKIVVQAAVAVLLLIDDVGTQCTRPLLGPLASRLFDAAGLNFHDPDTVAYFGMVVHVTSAALVVALVVFCCNATNLMDGLDGLCGGVTAVIAFGFLFVAVHMAMYGGGLNTNWDALRVVIGLATLGAVLGFVPYNFNPAAIFMGDTGSMLLGYVCAVMIVLMAQERPKWFLASMVMFALPVLDTSLAFARRWIAGRPLFSADAQHFHHQLVQRGFTITQTVLISYGLAIVFTLLGIVIVFVRTRYAAALYLVTFGSIVVAAYKMGLVHETLARGRAGMPGDTAGASGFEVIVQAEQVGLPAGVTSNAAQRDDRTSSVQSVPVCPVPPAA